MKNCTVHKEDITYKIASKIVLNHMDSKYIKKINRQIIFGKFDILVSVTGRTNR